MKKTLITSYYLILVTLISFQAIKTVFELSSTIGYGKQIAVLQKQKTILAKDIDQSSHLLAQKQSITFTNQSLDSYRLIAQPVVINSNQTVATR